MKKILFTLFLTFIAAFSYARDKPTSAITQPIPITELVGYENYPPQVKELVIKAFKLSQMNLTYMYASAEPKNKGMDCSGTIYYLLNQSKLSNVPRDSQQLFDWVKKQGNLYRATSTDFNSTEFSHLKPGDLLFWSGTYTTTHNISHVMMYLGKNKQGQRLMFGSSDGRTYQGKKMWGVSVFDFQLPEPKAKQKFEGYSCIPTLTCT